MDIAVELLKSFWNVFAMMAPWLVVGFLAAGVIAVWIPKSLVNRVMGGSTGWKGILRAVLIGVPLPICSCGVLPLATGLRRHGAGTGPTAAFLISTPQTGVDSILATYALMGPVFAIARPIAAAATGIAGGAIVTAVAGGDDASAPAVDDAGRASRGLKAVWTQAFRRLLGSVVKPLGIGLVISALVTVCVPDDFFVNTFHGSDWIAMPAMVLIGFPMYVCSMASIPIAASLMLKGISPGAAFVFLMVGPAMNAMSVTTVASLIGRKATAAYVATIALGAVVCGIVINMIPDAVPVVANASCCGEHGPSPLQQAAAVFLAAMMLYDVVKPFGMGGRKAECKCHCHGHGGGRDGHGCR